MTAGQRAELQCAGADLSGFEHIRSEQGVVDNAGELNAMIGEYVLIVFGVLQNFLGLHTFEPGFQAGERVCKR